MDSSTAPIGGIAPRGDQKRDVIGLGCVRNREAYRHFIEKWGIRKLDLEPAIVVSDIEKQLIASDLDFLAGKERLLVAATHRGIDNLKALIIFAPQDRQM